MLLAVFENNKNDYGKIQKCRQRMIDIISILLHFSHTQYNEY